MPNYRRAFFPGGCWFFTVNLLERRRTLLVDHVDALRDAFEQPVGRISRRRNPPLRSPPNAGSSQGMPNYRRAFIPGGCCFLTVKT
jgi:hypothetical protein